MSQSKQVEKIVKRLERVHSDDYSAFLEGKVPDISLEKAIRKKNLDYLKMLHKYGIFLKMFSKKPKYYFHFVVCEGGMVMFDWMYSLRLCDVYISYIFQLAVKEGNMALTQYLVEKERRLNISSLRKQMEVEDVSAFHPHSPKIYQWLYERGWKLTESLAMEHAAYFGDEDVFRWFYEKGFQGHNNAVFAMAVHSGNIPFVEWLYGEGYRAGVYADQVFLWAVQTGKLELIQSMHDKGYSDTAEERENVLREAAYKGDLRLLMWLHEHGYDVVRRRVLLWATHSGNMETVKWLYNNRYGKFRQWVYSKMESADALEAMQGAIRSGNLELVQWLYRKGFRCTGKKAVCILLAQECQNKDIHAWLQQHLQ